MRQPDAEVGIGAGPDEAAEGLLVFDRELIEEKEFWVERLSSSLESAELYLDRPRSNEAPGAWEVLPVFLDGEDHRRLQQLTSGKAFLQFTILMAAFKAFLHRYTGARTVVVGSPLRRREGGVRQRPGVLATIDEVDRGQSFRRLLLAVRETLLDAYRRQRYPFERLLQDLEIEPAAGRCPFFDTVLAFDELHAELPQLVNDLTLHWRREPARLAGRLAYRADLLHRTSVERLWRHYRNLLAAALADVEAPVQGLALISGTERWQLTTEWNDTGARAGCRPIHRLFEERAAADPEALAVVFENESSTYRELDERANRIARLLAGCGVRRGDLVGVWLDGSCDMIVGLLAILKAGAAYVPFDVDWPGQRVRGILAALGIRCLLTESAQLRPLHEIHWRLPQLTEVVCLDVEAAQPPAEALDDGAVRAVWDHVVETAVDRVTAAGFVSSYTGDPFSESEVDRYLERVVTLIGPRLGPGSRILEVGCGSGLILLELAPRVARAVGLDPSEAALRHNRARVRELGLDNVELRTAFAHEIDGLEAGSFDLVVFASVVQFFPGPQYLRRVLEQALHLLAPGGVVLLADLMDLRQRDDFHRSLEEFQARRRRTGKQVAAPGNELYVDEGYFNSLAAELEEIAEVEVAYRGEEFDNELRYRFDVLLAKAEPDRPSLRPIPPQGPSAHRRLWTSWHARELPTAAPMAAADGGDLAYVIFTSGSTGTPKGVMVRHSAAVNLIEWVNDTYHVGPGDRLLFVTSLCFDLSVYDIFGTLAAGATVQVASGRAYREPQRLLELLLQEPVTFWDSAPAVLQQLASLFSEMDGKERTDRLRLVFLSGDWIPLGLPSGVRQVFPGARVISLGGATEATIWSNHFPVEEIGADWTSIPYGRPIQGARYHVLGPSLEPCPIGVAGDLYIAGGCLAAGYIDSPALTAEKFLADPFDKEPGDRLYRTGDRARTWLDGTLEFLGRRDQQAKIRGFRIELAEVEAALGRHEALREVVVLAREDEPGEKRLVAYVVPRDSRRPTTGELQRFSRRWLPEYMVPSAVVPLDTLPLTANGKVDRAALAAPDGHRPLSAEGFVAPRSEVEGALAEIWGDVLGVDQVGVEDNFFELGGHSLKGTQVASRVRELFGVELPLRHLFKGPTVADLARVIEERRSSGGNALQPPPIVALPRQPRPDPVGPAKGPGLAASSPGQG